MGLDSVELVIAVEDTFGISIPDREAAAMITPALLISYVQRAVSSKPISRPCLSQRAFHHIRASLCEVTKCPVEEIRLETRLNDLFPKNDRRQRWDEFRSVSGLQSLPNLTFGRGILFLTKRVKDLVSREIYAMAEILRVTDTWSDQEVRSVVRHIISEQLDIKRFNDSDEFVRDLGLD